MTSRFLLYGLTDPRTEELRYIGVSGRGLCRPREHFTDWNLRAEGQSHKANWLRLLKRNDLRPGIVVLDELASADELSVIERKAIAFYRALGCRLTNATSGGDGNPGVVLSAETRAKISAAKKGVPRPAEMVERVAEKLRGRPLAAEHRAKIGAWHRGKVNSSETREKMAAAKRGIPRPPEVVARIAAKLKGQKFSEERRLRMREVLTQYWACPVVETTTGQVFRTQSEAARALGVFPGAVSRILAGKQAHSKGFRFRLLEVSKAG